AWHQDTVLPMEQRVDDADWGPWSIKSGVTHAPAPAWALEQVVALRVHLDDSSARNGPLLVIPGSHRLGVLSGDKVASIVRRGQVQTCLVGRGGVIAMRPLLVHASSKSENGELRRVPHIEYSSSMDLGS